MVVSVVRVIYPAGSLKRLKTGLSFDQSTNKTHARDFRDSAGGSHVGNSASFWSCTRPEASWLFKGLVSTCL